MLVLNTFSWFFSTLSLELCFRVAKFPAFLLLHCHHGIPLNSLFSSLIRVLVWSDEFVLLDVADDLVLSLAFNGGAGENYFNAWAPELLLLNVGQVHNQKCVEPAHEARAGRDGGLAYLVVGSAVLLIDVLLYEFVEGLLHRVEVLYVGVQLLALLGQTAHDSSQPLLANLGIRSRPVNRNEYSLGGPCLSNDGV